MLVRFTVSNYRSFLDVQEFTMMAAKHTRHSNHIARISNKRVLKGAVVYGANAAGKSNLIKAIKFGQNIVFDGITPGALYNRHFRIDPDALNRPGFFQYDFYSNGHFYTYGVSISYSRNVILSEWLIRVDNGNEVRVFERCENQRIETDHVFNSIESQHRFEIYAADVSDKKTFLSEITSHKLEEQDDFADYYNAISWFGRLLVIFPQTKYNGYDQYISNDSLNSITDLMRYFDTGIESVRGEEKNIEDVFSFLPDSLKNEIIDDIRNEFEKENIEETADGTPFSVNIRIEGRMFSIFRRDERLYANELVMSHGNDSDLFDISDESDGTKRLFDLVPLYKKVEQAPVILVDELDRSFHTKLTFEFIKRFFETTSESEAQLIVTLHDANVLDLSLLRQDEIWFAERQENHSTKLYSLNKFKQRFDRAIEKEYLLGRYGALPIFGACSWCEVRKDAESL